MRKDAAVSVRVPGRLKAELEKVASNEGRSLSQICEALLTGGLATYRREGSKFLQRFITRRNSEVSAD